MSASALCRGCACPTECYKHQFRILVMKIFMDHLAMEEIEKFFFVYDLPARLRDIPGKLRSEVLSYVQHQGLMDNWSKNPAALKQLLRELGRANLAAKVQEFMTTFMPEESCIVSHIYVKQVTTPHNYDEAQSSKTTVFSAEKDQRDVFRYDNKDPVISAAAISRLATASTKLTRKQPHCDLVHCEPPTLSTQYEAIARHQLLTCCNNKQVEKSSAGLGQGQSIKSHPISQHQLHCHCDTVEGSLTSGLKHQFTVQHQHGGRLQTPFRHQERDRSVLSKLVESRESLEPVKDRQDSIMKRMSLTSTPYQTII